MECHLQRWHPLGNQLVHFLCEIATLGADRSEYIRGKTSCALQIGDDRLVPHSPRLPFTLFPEQGPGMKAVSPLSLEPRELLGLLEVEETKRAAAQSSCVCVVWPSQAFSGLLLHCALPLSQPASLPLRGGVLEWWV